MMQDCPPRQSMLEMMLMITMMIITDVLVVARYLLIVSKPSSVRQHLLTSGSILHSRGAVTGANAIEAMSKTESPAVTQHRSLENQHVTSDAHVVRYAWCAQGRLCDAYLDKLLNDLAYQPSAAARLRTHWTG